VVGAFAPASAAFLVAGRMEAPAATCAFRERKKGFAPQGSLDLQSLLASKYPKAKKQSQIHANTESQTNEDECPYHAVIVPSRDV